MVRAGTSEERPVQGIYPFNLDVDSPAVVRRWRPLLNWLLVIPHQLWLFVLLLGVEVVAFLGWFAIMFTGRLPERWGDYIMSVLRYQWRISTYLYAWTDMYPEFATPAGYVDPNDYPAVLYSARPQNRNRLTVFFRALLAIPHYIVLYIFSILAFVVLVAGWFVVLFTGRWPVGMRGFCVGWQRWSFRVLAYVALVTDDYPPFGVAP
jgi:hypothetical protein